MNKYRLMKLDQAEVNYIATAGPAQTIYAAAEQAAKDAYAKTIGPAQSDYNNAMDQAIATYQDTMRPAWDAFYTQSADAINSKEGE